MVWEMRVTACSMPVMHCLSLCKFSESCHVMSLVVYGAVPLPRHAMPAVQWHVALTLASIWEPYVRAIRMPGQLERTIRTDFLSCSVSTKYRKMT